jgi:clan AA aspartic protease (TIGR02281 family)
MTRYGLLAIALSLTCAATASAEIYRWTDAGGTLHFSQDLSQVPPKYRSQAQQKSSSSSTGSFQTFAPPASRDRAPRRRPGKAMRIPFERRGTLMWVNATVNDRQQVPFLIDTGASGVSLPSQVVTDLGIRIGSDTPRVTVGTANGPMRVPLVRLDSVQLGPARVEGLHATVNPSMNVGLLGGSFFNNFTYSVDSAASVITLVPNDGVRGGAAADQWRERFRDLRSSIDRLETYLSEREVTRLNSRLELEGNLAALKQGLVELEIEANHARVPQTWRR